MHANKTALLAAGCVLLATSPVVAQDEAGELWFNPAFVTSIDDWTSIELETAQRLREDPRDDTYFARLWVNREDSSGREWSLGVEQRWVGADEKEVRLLQQVKYDWGPLEFRTRLEQRFIDVDPQTGARLRQRIGTTVPLSDDEDGWALTGDAELFVTLRNTEPGGADRRHRPESFRRLRTQLQPVRPKLGLPTTTGHPGRSGRSHWSCAVRRIDGQLLKLVVRCCQANAESSPVFVA